MKIILKITLLLFIFSISLNAQDKKMKKVRIIEDAFIQGGQTSSTAFGTKKPKDLYVFNSEADSKYSRITFLKFKLDRKQKEVSSVELIINIKVYLSKTSDDDKFSLQVYGVEDDNWDESSITWDDAPELDEVLGSALIEQSKDSRTHTVKITLDADKFNKLIGKKDKYVTLALFNDNFNKISSKVHAKEQGFSNSAYLKIK